MKLLLTKISKYEWKHIMSICLIVISLSLLPFIYGQLHAPPEKSYNGLHALTHGDFSVYYSYINQIKNGQIVLYNNFTLEPQQHGIFNIFWFIVGITARILHLSPSIALQLFKILLTPLAIIILYLFISQIFDTTKTRILTIWTLCFSSGVGTYAIPFLLNNRFQNASHWPIDYWVPESNTFLTLYHLPHAILSLTLIVSIYILLLKSLQYKNLTYGLYMGIIGLVLFNYHPYHAIVLNTIIGLYILLHFIRTPRNWLFQLKLFLLWFIPSTISIIYHYLLITTDIAIGIRASQNITLTPPFPFVVLGYGFLFIFALCGLYFYFKKKKPLPDSIHHMDFVVIWFFVNSLLLYFPITFQRRFLSGYHIPIVILTVFSLSFFTNKYFAYLKKNHYLSITLAMLFIFLSSFVNVVRDISLLHNYDPNFYNSQSMIHAIDWLEKNNMNYVVLTEDTFNENDPFSASYWIPSYINQRTYLSHDHETLFYDEKHRILKDLVTKNDPKEWSKLYEDFGIGYVMLKNNQSNVYYNSRELDQVYINKEYAIFRTHIVN